MFLEESAAAELAIGRIHISTYDSYKFGQNFVQKLITIISLKTIGLDRGCPIHMDRIGRKTSNTYLVKCFEFGKFAKETEQLH